MYAVIRTGGKQYRVAQGDTLEIETISGEPGAAITFDDVLLVGDDGETRIGTPTVEGATVSGTIVNHGKGRKVIVFKFRRRKNYKRKNGHRQNFTRVRIDGITLN
ncbi:MAG: 50S ribosomal protein L21 [Myxococcota bacterium]